MQTLLDPSFIFISEEDWNDENTRIDFLESMLKIFDLADKYPPMSFCWSNTLEHILWSSTFLSPWKFYAKNQMIAIYYKKFYSNQTLYEESSNQTTLMPEINWCSIETRINECYQDLINSIFDIDINFLIYLNTNRDINNITISSKQKKISPIIVLNNKEYLQNVSFVDFFWDYFEVGHNALKSCIELEMERVGAERVLVNYELTDNFIKDITKEKNKRFRVKIIEQLTKRLTLSHQDAAKDSTLRDEYLEQSKCHRFRVTQKPTSCRIHYVFNKNSIQLTNYYSDGEHDAGL